MYIEITLKPDKTHLGPTRFPILLNALEEAMNDCYLGIGTPYEPIAIDNFVTIGKDVFPTITPKTEISIELCADTNENKNAPLLVCSTVKNVGKEFTDKDLDIKGYWKNIFDVDDNLVQCAPDGTLYVTPRENGKCVISTKDGKLDDYVSYSIMFSMIMKNMDNNYRRYYFVLDPLVKISSGGGTPIEDPK